MNSKSIGEELEHNPLQKTIAKYALPAIFSGLVAALYNIVDQLFIGHIIGIDGLLYAGQVADSLAFAITMVFLRNEIKELKDN